MKKGTMDQSKQSSRIHMSDARPEFIILGLLRHRSMHGYDLYRQFQTNLGLMWHISQSQMYSILKRLEGQGLIEGLEGENDTGEGPARRYLVVTPLGLSRFSTWLMTPSDCSSRVLRLEFISRLFFASMEGREVTTIIVQDQAAKAEHEFENHKKLLDSLPEDDVFNRLSMEFRVRQLATILEWLHQTVEPLIK